MPYSAIILHKIGKELDALVLVLGFLLPRKQDRYASWQSFPALCLAVWLIVSGAVAAFIVGEVASYFLHQYRTADTAIARQQQMSVELQQVHTQIDELTSKMNVLAARLEQQPAASLPTVEGTPAIHIAAPNRRPTENLQLKKMQSQLDQQGKAIDQQGKALDQEGKAIADTQNQLESTRRDLNNTHVELTGLIAHTHEELLLLQKKVSVITTSLTSSRRNSFNTKARLVSDYGKLTPSINTRILS